MRLNFDLSLTDKEYQTLKSAAKKAGIPLYLFLRICVTTIAKELQKEETCKS